MFREKAKIALYGNRIVIDEGTEEEWELPFEDLSAVSVLGKNKLNVYYIVEKKTRRPKSSYSEPKQIKFK